MAQPTKRCSHCAATRPVEQFNRDKSRPDGLFPWCQPCHRAYAKAQTARLTPAERRERRARNIARREANAEMQQRHIRKTRLYTMRKRYGITPAEYEALIASQHNRCKICGREGKPDAMLHIDHCHTTGAVRGLLCLQCNAGLGHFKDDTDLLTAAITYLTG